MTFIPKFADLVRNAVTVEGEGAAALGPAVPGFQGFAQALSVGDRFYYSLANEDRPNEREVGKGTLLDGGLIERSAIDGVPTQFTSGTKTIALVAAAEYFSGASGGDVREGLSLLPASPASLFAAAAPVALSYALAIAPDFGSGINFDLMLSGDAYLADPKGAKPGQSGRIRVTQDDIGGKSLTFGPRWQFAGGTPKLSSAPGAVDLVAYFVNGVGGIEATLLPGLRALPAPLSVSNFQHGYYAVHGERMELGDLWVEDAEYGPFVPGSIVDGAGWRTVSNTTTINTLVTTAGHAAALGALGAGVTLVLDYELVQPSGTKPRIVAEVRDMPAATEGWGYYHNGRTNIFTYDHASDGIYDQRYAGEQAPVGDIRVAMTMAGDGLHYSLDGEAAYAVVGDPQDNVLANAIALACYTSHDSVGEAASATLRSIAIYAKQPASMLPLLSGR